MIPEQKPDKRPRSLRPRGDHYTLPRFPQPDRPTRQEPLDGGDWSTYREPEPLAWDDLKDPANLIGGLLVFVAIVIFILAASIQDVR